MNLKFRAPIMVDQTTGKASVTLTFCYCMFFPAFVSNWVVLNQPTAANVSAWGACQVSFFLAFFMYRMRGLDKVKANIQGNSLELSATPEQPTKETP